MSKQVVERLGAVQGQVLALYGPKGGVGTTMVACNLAVALHRVAAAAVILIDAGFHLGSVATFMGLEPLEAEAWEAGLDEGLVTHASGVLVLPAPNRTRGVLEQGHPWVAAAAIERLLDEACRRARFVLVDTRSVIDAPTTRILERASRILVVLTPETAALRDGRSFLRFCAQRDLASKVLVVVNRCPADAGFSPEQVERVFGDRLLGRIPSHGLVAVEAANTGRLLVETVPQHPLSMAIFHLARSLAAGGSPPGGRHAPLEGVGE